MAVQACGGCQRAPVDRATGSPHTEDKRAHRLWHHPRDSILHWAQQTWPCPNSDPEGRKRAGIALPPKQGQGAWGWGMLTHCTSGCLVVAWHLLPQPPGHLWTGDGSGWTRSSSWGGGGHAGPSAFLSLLWHSHCHLPLPVWTQETLVPPLPTSLEPTSGRVSAPPNLCLTPPPGSSGSHLPSCCPPCTALGWVPGPSSASEPS